MSNKIWIIILIISLFLIAASGYNIVKLYREYQAGIDEYEELEQYVLVEEPAEALEDTQTDSKINVSLQINHPVLEAMNPDYCGWLYYEPLKISYPIVRGQDNEYYVKHTFEGEENKSGAIFMDSYNWPDYGDYNTFIYGHNMRNRTMFGSLKKLLNDEEKIVENNPYFYVFTEEKAYMYEIFAVYNTKSDSDTYHLIHSKEEQEANIAHIKEKATWLSDKEIKSEDKIVTLSTCYGVQTKNRTVVQGVLVVAEDR